MSARRRLAVALGLMAAACSGQIDGDPAAGGPAGPGNSGGNPPNPGTSGPPSSPPSGGGSPGPGAPPGVIRCAVLTPVSLSTLQDLPAGPGVNVRVRVQTTSGEKAATSMGAWLWTVLHGDGVGTRVEVSPVDESATTVEVPLEKVGRYRISAAGRLASDGSICEVMTTGYARDVSGRLASFRVRLTPPSGSPYPVQELPLQAISAEPVRKDLALLRGEEVTLEPQDAAGTGGVPSYVRITQTTGRSGSDTSAPLTFEGHTARGAFRPHLVLNEKYNVLVVPDGEGAVAPALYLDKTTSALSLLELRLTPGAALGGQLTDGAGRPLGDARVVLRAGMLTSTVGTSSASGGFTVRARPGRYALTVVPPPGSGLPEIELKDDGPSGLSIGAGAAAGSLDVRWAPSTTASVGLVVRTSNGLTAARDARVRLERLEPLPDAATVTFKPSSGAEAVWRAPGLVRSTALVGGDGAVVMPPVAQGRYRLTIVPADADPASAVTTLLLDVGPGGVSGRQVQLSARVKLRGRLLPEGAVGARVFARAMASGVARPAFSALVGPDGRYELDVDPDVLYVISAEPPPGSPFARAQLARVMAGAAGAEAPEVRLPAGLALSGTVHGGRQTDRLKDVVIQIFCETTTPRCLDPTLPVAETVSTAIGDYQAVLPDPGSF